MFIQKVKGKCAQDVKLTVKALDEEVSDERFVNMGKYYLEERDAVMRDTVQRT